MKPKAVPLPGESHHDFCLRREAEGGTVRYDYPRAQVRAANRAWSRKVGSSPEVVAQQEAAAEKRRLKPGKPRKSKSDLWPRVGAKEKSRMDAKEAVR